MKHVKWRQSVPVPPLTKDEPESSNSLFYIYEYDQNYKTIDEETEYGNETNTKSATSLKAKIKMIISALVENEGLCCKTEEDKGWIDILTVLCWKASLLIRPNYNEANEMDPRSYLKVKCIATGTPSESEVVDGLVFTKKAAHKNMVTSFKDPKFLLIKGDLGESQFSLLSLGSIEQETDEMRSSIGKLLDSYQSDGPDIILAERSIPIETQYMLLKKGITLVNDMKLHRLERISKCTGSMILSFNDFITTPFLNECKYFHLQQFTEECDQSFEFAKRPSKSMMFLEGLTRPLGCTALLKGASTEELKRIKKILQHAVFAAYNLICETSIFKNQISHLESNSSKYVEKRDIITEGILVLVSKRCIIKNVICENGKLYHLKYCDNSDVPLGQYLINLLNQSEWCDLCGESPSDHIYSYTHKNRNLNVYLQNPSPRGIKLYGGIWKWIRCLKCRGKNIISQPKIRSMMSELALNTSFGKFLEFCFYSDGFSSRCLSSCGHLFPQDCIMYFGMNNKVVMFKHSLVDVYTACGPSPKIGLNNIPKKGNISLKNNFRDILSRGLVLFSEVAKILQQFRGQNANIPLLLRLKYFDSGSIKGIYQVKEMLRQEKMDFKANLLKAIEECENNELNAIQETLTLNWLYQYLFLETYVWDQRLNHLLKSRKIKEQNNPEMKNPETKTWIWNPFPESISEFKQDIQHCFMEKFCCINNYFPINIPTLHEDFVNANNHIQFVLGPSGSILSIYENEISSIISCGLAIIEEYSLFQNSAQTFSRSDFLNVASPELHPKIHIDGEFGLNESYEYDVTCFHAMDFYNLRKKYSLAQIEYRSSLSRCKDWDVKGGKSKGFFVKTLDERFVLKQIKSEELESFLQFAPRYFGFVSENLDSCLAKIFGIYQVKQIKKGKETKIYLMVMENILFGRKIYRTYHLKGGNLNSNSKLDLDSNDQETMDYSDLNFIEDLHKSPIHVNVHSKRMMQRAIWNDTSFLSKINVMNYSLIVGLDEERKELVYGIINYLEKYSWTKQFEHWVQSCIMVPENMIIEPKEYKKRFRKYMVKYFPAIPNA